MKKTYYWVTYEHRDEEEEEVYSTKEEALQRYEELKKEGYLCNYYNPTWGESTGAEYTAVL